MKQALRRILAAFEDREGPSFKLKDCPYRDGEWVRLGLQPNIGLKSLAEARYLGLIEIHPRDYQRVSGSFNPVRYRLTAVNPDPDLGDLWVE